MATIAAANASTAGASQVLRPPAEILHTDELAALATIPTISGITCTKSIVAH